MWTSQCPATWINSSPVSTTNHQHVHNIAHIPPHHKNLARTHKSLLINMHSQSYRLSASSTYSKSSVLSCIMQEQWTSLHLLPSAATLLTEEWVTQLLDYLHTHKDATIRYIASDMVLNVHSDASYLSESCACSRLGGTFFLGCIPTDNMPIQLIGPILVGGSICKFVVASVAKAELGALFYNC